MKFIECTANLERTDKGQVKYKEVNLELIET